MTRLRVASKSEWMDRQLVLFRCPCQRPTAKVILGCMAINMPGQASPFASICFPPILVTQSVLAEAQFCLRLDWRTSYKTLTWPEQLIIPWTSFHRKKLRLRKGGLKKHPMWLKESTGTKFRQMEAPSFWQLHREQPSGCKSMPSLCLYSNFIIVNRISAFTK